MTPNDEKLIRYKEQRSKEAIDLAMQARWQEAVTVNEELIQSFPDDVDTYNRLGRAYMELGKYSKAKDAYHKTVKLEPYNAIANRNLRRLADLKETPKSHMAQVETDKVEPEQFIEEIGKAGVVTLTDLAPKEKRALTVAGDKAIVKLDGSYMVAESAHGDYLGKVEPKQATRLIRLMMGGNKYSAVVVKSTADGMTIMVRETYQHPSQAGKLSFPPKGMEEVRAYASDRVVKEETEEDDSGYTIIGGDEVEVLPEEHEVEDDDTGNDDE